jgi:outer membrane protein assembly factor BamB
MFLDWPGWRGPQRDAVAPAAAAPKQWPKALRRTWQTAAGGGYSTPVVAGNRVFVHGREGNQETVTAADLNTGKMLWQHRYSAPFQKSQYATQMEPGPFSTPAFDNGRLYTLGPTSILTCLDAATGRVLWNKDSLPAGTAKLYTGTSMSPIVEGANVIAHLGDDTRAVLTAFDATTGAERWSWKQDDAPGYASPIAGEFHGTRQLITLTDRRAVAVHPASGATLWSLPFEDQWKENIVTPVRAGNRVIFSGIRRGTIAVEVPPPQGAKWSPKVAWEAIPLTMYMSSPIVDGDTLFGFSQKQKGHFFALDTKTGKVLWTSEGRRGETAGLLSVGAHLLALLPDGELVVMDRTAAAYREVARYKVADAATWSQPVPTGSGLIVKSVNSLSRWDW